MSVGVHERSTSASIVFVADASLRCPLLKVEENSVEAEEQECDGGTEPGEGVVAESMGVNPDADSFPGLWLAEEMCRVRSCDEDCKQAGRSSKSGGVSLGIVEANFLDEGLNHQRIDQTCDAGTRSDHTDSKALLLPKPGSDD